MTTVIAKSEANQPLPAAQDISLWSKLVRYGRTVGSSTVEKVLQLYYAAKAPNTPIWARTVIYGALAYFILPVDAIPDFIPVAGFADDLGTIMAALGVVAWCITPDVKDKAKATIVKWFGEHVESKSN